MSKDFLFSMIMSAACLIGFSVFFFKENILLILTFGFLCLYFLIFALLERIETLYNNDEKDEKIELLISALKYSHSTAKLAIDFIDLCKPSKRQEQVIKELEEMINKTKKAI